jgi:O-antigen ligase/Tfp pilus assembly protein PilF
VKHLLPQQGNGGWLAPALVLALSLTAALIDQANYQQDLTFIALNVIVALMALAVALARRPSDGRWPLGPAGALFLGLIAWSALSVTWSRVPYLTFVDLAAMGSVACAYAAWRIVTAPAADRHSPILPAGLLIAGVAMAAFMIGQFFTGHRPTAFFANPNSAATLLNALWPVAAVAWLAGRGTLLGTPRAHHGLLAVMFVLVFGVGIDGSRAAFLAGVGVLIVVLVGAGYTLGARRRSLALIAVIFVTALLSAWLVNVLGLGTGRLLGERIGSLAAPDQAGAVRFLQWAGAWSLIREAPWLGIGPDVFWLAYAGIRPPGDGSAGLYAHNDYLQFWAERGLVGLVLVLGIIGACIQRFAATLRARTSVGDDDAVRAMSLAAFAGLTGLSIHGLFSYQLQMPSVLIPAFLLIAELERLAPSGPVVNLRLPNWRRPLSLIAGMGVFALIAVSIGLTGASQLLMDKGVAAMNRGEFEAAEQAFQTAQRRWGNADTPWLHHAVLYQRLLRRVPEDEPELRASLASEAMRLLDRAAERNPLRARTPAIRGQLRRAYPDLTEGDPREAFERALALDPRQVSARLNYVAWLRAEGDERAARKLLEDGVTLDYGRRTRPIPLYQATAAARSSAGDSAGATALLDRVEQIRVDLQRRLNDSG